MNDKINFLTMSRFIPKIVKKFRDSLSLKTYTSEGVI